MNNLLESLQKIGLSPKESKIYLSLLSFGSASVSDIADSAGIKRPTAYLILDELRKKGLVLKIPHAKKIIFQAKQPDELYEQATNNLNDFEKALPKLRSINPSPNVVKTFYFEGMEGFKEALNYKSSETGDKELFAFWARNKYLPKTTKDIFKKFNSKLDAQKGKTKIITIKDTESFDYFEQFPKLKSGVSLIGEDDYSSDISIEACDNFIRIIDGHELKVVIIENQRVADAIKQIFNLVEKGINK